MTSTTLHVPNQTTAGASAGSPARTWLGVAAIVLAVAGTAVVGGLVTASAVRTWYPTITRPAWTPPDWVFGPVWTVLYALMALAASIVWVRRDRADVGTLPPAR